jgi:hypothetical protein
MIEEMETTHFVFATLGGTMRENRYQAFLIDRLNDMFPGCVVLKNDTDYLQGIPDLLILYEDRWAMLWK